MIRFDANRVRIALKERRETTVIPLMMTPSWLALESPLCWNGAIIYLHDSTITCNENRQYLSFLSSVLGGKASWFGGVDTL